MKLPQHLLKVYTRLDGAKVYAHLSAPERGSSNMNNPFQIFHAPEPCRLVKEGDIVLAGSNMFLLMAAPQSQLGAKTFRAYSITNKYPWTRNVKSVDPVSKVKRDMGVKDMGFLYAYFEKPSETRLDNMTETRYQFYTGQDVIEGDMIGNKMVKSVIEILGVKLVVAE